MSGKLNAILAVVAGGALDAIASEVIDGKDFNFTNGIQRVACIALVGGFIALGSWWLQARARARKENG